MLRPQLTGAEGSLPTFERVGGPFVVAEDRGAGVSTSAGMHMKGYLLDNAPESRGVERQQIVPVFVCVGGGQDASHVDAP